MSDNTIAALDLGSNTFRLMLAARGPEGWLGKKVYQHIPRLSENLAPGGPFAPQALERAHAALAEFNGLIKEAGARTVLAGATMAARISAEGPAFMAALENRYGWQTRILPGEEEGRLTALGVLSGLNPVPEEGLVFDIGGRSTEFVRIRGKKVLQSRSLALGVVELTERFLHDPPEAGDLADMVGAIRQVLAEARLENAPTPVIGTAGTVTTIAALLLKLEEYEPDLVNNARLDTSAIAKLLDALSKLTIKERVDIYKLPERRADAIVAGLVIVLEVMAHFSQASLTVSDNGLLEGLWLKAAGFIE